MRGRSLFLASFFALLGFCVLVALGIWQVRRLEWKTDLLSRLEQAINTPPSPYAPPLSGENEHSREFRRVRVTGLLDTANSVRRFSPTPEAARAKTSEGFGYEIFTPLEFDNHMVFVDRGFVPESEARAVIAASGDKTATIIGIIRMSEQPSWLTPAADEQRKVFYSADIPSMAAAAHRDGAGAVTGEYIEADATPNPGGWPLGRDPRELLAAIPNRHLEYALTWFGLAATLLGFFIVYTIRPRFN
jgi:surfeit locus 1 family protein